MKKLLITGAKGMLGQDLQKAFVDNYEIVAWDLEDLDITNEEAVKNKALGQKPDIIINAVGYNDVDKAEEDDSAFELAKKVNGMGPKYLAEVAKELDAVFVHYISDYVFDGKKGEYTEDDRTSPISNYGISKEIGEKNVMANDGKDYVIRTSKLFGKPGSGKQSFFEKMIELSEKLPELKVVDSEKSCFCYTPDLAEATKKLIEDNSEYGLYHIINEGAVTWFEAAKRLFQLMNKEIKITPVGPDEFPRPAKRPESSILVNTKLPKLRHYEEALKEWLS